MAKEKEKRLTREDILRLIEENGGTAKGLDLSGREFEAGIDLRKLDLRGIILKKAIFLVSFGSKEPLAARFDGSKLWHAQLEEANLQYAHLEEAMLTEAHLERVLLCGAHLERADLIGAHLEGADLSITHLEEADFGDARLEGVFLWGAKFSSDTDFGNVNWGNYILGDEKQQREKGEEFVIFWEVDNIYRRLKLWHTSAGMYDIAGEFFFREMTIRRKVLKWWPNPIPRAWSKFLSLICGYGEKWHRVIISAVVVVFGLALIYLVIGTLTPNTFLNSLYYSAVSFTALGYGSWAPEPTGWVKGLGAFEAFIGVFMMALFLITFVRKMTR